jgi:hypothetical protein
MLWMIEKFRTYGKPEAVDSGLTHAGGELPAG